MGRIKPFLLSLLICINFCAFSLSKEPGSYGNQIKAILREHVMAESAWALNQKPIMITSHLASASEGGKHDFFPQADYFWPDPQNPNGPYISKDGLTNPANFNDHRKVMIRFSRIIGALASAYKIMGKEIYVAHATLHLKAWFIGPETLMNPNMLFAQAVIGKFPGRN